MKIQAHLFTVMILQSMFAFSQKSTTSEFESLKYTSGMCFGVCPLINCTIEKKKIIKIERIVFKKFETIDTAQSGSFVGKLTQQEWLQFSNFIASRSLSKEYFPDKFCCDNPIVAIYLKKKGEEKVFRSMFPREEAMSFISFLYKLSLKTTYTKIGYDPGLYEKLR